MSDRTWECTRCQAKRHHQANVLPIGWEWRVIYTVILENKLPVKYEARCPKCVAREPRTPTAPPPSPRQLPW